ncbi:MAG: UDP-N-acetylglucosamine 1-carboxyvinyltransferase [Candidatus Yanofskybacteria bacterium RIFCSPHIGHO2_01_FULL_43_42]|uniref:UDP-N-acetylglucosamine 1-carboxyvinyltransferase n=1 Tax=Candidatus Yanofskybacteria bacterium RIFCSPLOWO2_01_FULL_43_22 TaxID=1802695 RepID=A0A1F8GD73_9BACT|nr:MAG: UDP-N-acetylglucosamine 1-carboxyvinyltransferase [Candidatus Yanofskybacteria bacterium RIFCSPHIGHO2_01_FULL_43_42]OGN12703.1 MAG: UDP-N-acetylglucosamine 1-carboxyvinyltransferase [Candidatus Yanofskybacteria bacterium RIFCSPHIGHO2_02_FULL_43_17]OGN23325.1 MAG: UDP-N-acetylglucosamine 1-carboxyvinyltransferase [Candidatus Yanofskybacteria bacterium RIFCSPLOWO2_01_FULL_43_22]
MQKFIINGGKKLKGNIEVKGAKNDALVIFAASLLTSQPIMVSNVPEIEDTKRLLELLEKLGCKVKRIKYGEYKIKADSLASYSIDPEIAKRIRASILLTAPLLVRFGKVKFPHPGGCVIGERPIDQFLEGYKSMGAKTHNRGRLHEIVAPRLKGAEFIFNNITVTGTESLIMAAVLAKGRTVLKNCACEPEVKSLADFLNSCGAKITGAGTPHIVIEGVDKLKGGTHKTIPDRVEAGSFIILAATLNSNVVIKNCEPEHLDALLSVLRLAGVNFTKKRDRVEVKSSKLTSVNIKTHEYPGFPTDLQAPFCVLLTQSKGQGLVHETIYEGRLLWTEELKRMGANIHTYDPHRIEIKGPAKLRGREVESPDIRAGMAYLIAALCAKGRSTINNVYQIDRGYEKIEERMKKIGADIRRI